MNCWSLLVTILVISAIIGSYIWIGVVQAGNAPLSKLNVTGNGVIEGDLTVNGTIHSSSTASAVSSILPENVVTIDSSWFGAAEGTLTVLGANDQAISSEMTVSSTTVDFAGRRLIDLQDPCLPQDAATKSWVEQYTVQNNPASVKTLTLPSAQVDTSQLMSDHPLRNYTGQNFLLLLANGLVVNSVTLETDDRLLVLNHALPQINGVYVIGDIVGSRAQDMSQGKLTTYDIRVPVGTASYLLVTPVDAKNEPNVDQQASGNATDSCGEPYDPLVFVHEPCFMKMHDCGEETKEDVLGRIPLVDCNDPCKARSSESFQANITPEGIVTLMASNPLFLTLGGQGGLRFRALDNKVYIDLVVDGGESTMSLEFSENNVQTVATPPTL